MEFNKLDSIFEETSKYCHLAKENDFMEVVKWHNGEGFDVNLSARGNDQKFSLTHGEMELLAILSKIEDTNENAD